MARVKLSEFDAKRLLFPTRLVFAGKTGTKSGELTKFFGTTPLVVKVDQGIKKRGLQGLVKTDVTSTLAIDYIRKWSDLGYTNFLVEPLVSYQKSSEQYLSLERTRYGWNILYSDIGGIEIEKHWDQVTTHVPPKIKSMLFSSLIPLLDKFHIASLELNPFLWQDQQIIPIDAAAEIDDAALSLAELAPYHLSPIEERSKSNSEKQIAALDASTPASLKFRLLSPEGKIWMLLSGGGASLVLADEVADLGLGEELANYGEYSGAPTEDDTYSYTKIILKQMLSATNQKPQALIIAGGVANFTDVAKTFKGIIRALREKQKELVKADVRVFVRRGGPNEKKGLAIMTDFLKNSGLYGSVHGHDTPLTQIITEVKGFLNQDSSDLSDRSELKNQ